VFGRAAFAVVVAVVALAFVRFLLKQEGLAKEDTVPLVGTWKLVDERTILADGTLIRTRNSAPMGILVYDDAGHFTSQLFRPNASKAAGASNVDSIRTGSETSEYEGYFGTYALDPAKETIIFHVDAAVPTENAGKDLAEQFSIVGSKLTTQARIFTRDGTPATHILVWTRLN
jgi:hypothetical protein